MTDDLTRALEVADERRVAKWIEQWAWEAQRLQLNSDMFAASEKEEDIAALRRLVERCREAEARPKVTFEIVKLPPPEWDF